VDYDDAFVAWLDGVEIKRANTTNGIGAPILFNATAATSREASCCNAPLNPATVFDLGAVSNRLATGTHVLALQCVNQSSGSTDSHLIADLAVSGGNTGGSVNGTFFSIVESSSVVLTGSNTVAGSTRVTINGDDASFDSVARTWAKTNSLLAGVNNLFIAALDDAGHLLANTNRMVVSEVVSNSIGGILGSNTIVGPGIVHVTNTAVVPAGGTVSIQPGTVCLMAPGASILATNATLNALGTLASPIYFLPADGSTTNWGELAMSGTNGAMLLQHVETIAGHIEVFDGAVGTLEDSYFHDYWTTSPAIIHTLGQPNPVTLNMRRCHVARYQEVLSQIATNHLEDCLMEYQGYSGDGIDFDWGQEGSYIKRCTVRRGLIFNTDALDMGELSGNASEGTHALIESCLLHDFIDKGVSLGQQVYVTVTNTLIYNVDAGIAVKDNSVAGVFNCTVANANYGFHEYNKANAAATNGGGSITNSFNNILWFTTNASVSLLNGSTLVASYSDFQNTNWPGAGNFNSDPLFLNAAIHDYRVASNSPTVGAGIGGANLGVMFPVGGIPATPLALSAVQSGTNPVQLIWQDDADNETAFVIERSTNGATWNVIGSAGENVTNYFDATAVLGAKNYYRVHASNTSGDSDVSNLASATRQIPFVYVGGNIASNTFWSASSIYVVTSSVTVVSGFTLTMEAGMQLRFNPGFRLVVANGGRVVAGGTSNAPILFTRSGTTGTWGGITVNGSVGSPETRIAYARFEFNAQNPCIQVSAGTVFFDHLTFGNNAASYIHLDGASFIVQDCEFPSGVAQFELIHGTGGIKSGGHGIISRNFFGLPIGYNDVVDFTGGNRPNQAIIHFLNNVFIGGSDDILDLDGTDAWVEGNIFLHCHKNGSADTASGISGSDDSGNISEITAMRNIFFDCDQAVMAKGGNFYTLINNTIAHQTHQGGTDTDGAVVAMSDDGFPEGAGMYLEGNIIFDVEKLLRFYTNSIVTFTNNQMQLPWTGPGGNNSTADPLFNHTPLLSETVFTNWAQAQIMRTWLGLQTNSPAIGTGPSGRDKGGIVSAGASISGEPGSVTNQTNATLSVGINRSGNGIPAAGWPLGSGYTHYKWRLDGGAWSAEKTIATPITITNLAAGAHYVEVTGKRDSTLYQDDSLFGFESVVSRSKTWIVGAIDSDGDGIPDDWEIAYNFDPNNSADAALDGDNDGMTNLQEFQAGTNPTNASSRLALNVSILGSTAIELQIDAVSNKTYSVEYKTDLATGTWQNLQNIAAAPTNRSVVVTNGTSDVMRFYRLVVPIAP
ncbi:MAG: thrombospondin type 3 repeat-containing protein, partial [Verrucomicrobiota bacterium]